MIIPKEYEKDINSICADFENAERLVVFVKGFTGKEAIPAISELRYAGYHLVQWFRSGEDNDLLKAKEHSKRATFEAARYGIYFCSEEIRYFRKVYGGDILPSIIPDYAREMKEVEDLKASISQKNNKSAEERVESCVEGLYKIKDIRDKLIVCQPDLNKKKRVQSIGIIGAVAAIIGVVFAIVSYLLQNFPFS
jgi:hypothetical protein